MGVGRYFWRLVFFFFFVLGKDWCVDWIMGVVHLVWKGRGRDCEYCLLAWRGEEVYISILSSRILIKLRISRLSCAQASHVQSQVEGMHAP